ncbi:prenyltransferase/squalene oxidase repeat-containing protein [Salinispora tropica]|uniref:prenyltransferase/squalene oxidase repeat-containing protein n=1 Tax=Salinispora tropica TaxID=168695 RepID=UPI00048EE490|nr:prenyltransferase/squalene oxidase repeat-containing protein [Salinispora tropica]
MSLSRRLATGLGAAAATTLAAVAAAPLIGVAAPDPDHAAAARAAASWLAGEFTDGILPGPATPEDWGLTIDGILALSATGVDPSTRQAATAQVAANVRAYNSYDHWGHKGYTDGGATAKLLYAASVTGAEPTDFGGYDLRAETLSLIAGADTDHQRGRITSRSPSATGWDPSNTFDQSFAVVGLSRSGGVPQDAVDFLIRQQCAAGGFRLFPDTAGGPSPSCDAQPDAILDVDSTAMAVQALLSAAENGAAGAADAADAGADWLVSQQHNDGSFGGSGPTTGTNSNSTGLAGQALAAAGHDAEANQAARALAALQLTTANGGAAAAEAGAIAYNAGGMADAVTDGLADNDRDQWRRATAQALLGLVQVPLGRIGLDPPPPTGAPTPTGTASPTTSPTGTGSPTPTATVSPTPSATGTVPSETPSAPPTSSAPVTPTPTTPSLGGLPTTGAAITSYVLLTVLLLGGGVGLLVLGRRRAS